MDYSIIVSRNLEKFHFHPMVDEHSRLKNFELFTVARFQNTKRRVQGYVDVANEKS